MYKKLLSAIVLFNLLGINVSAQQTTEAYTKPYESKNPISWSQITAPYAEEPNIFCRATHSVCGDGMHALTVLLLKAGVIDEGVTPTQVYPIMVSTQMGKNVGGYAVYDWSKVDDISKGKVKYLYEDWSINNKKIKTYVDMGYLLILNVSLDDDSGLGGHLVVVDSVDNYDIVMIDSATRGKYLSQLGKVESAYIFDAGLTKDQVKTYW